VAVFKRIAAITAEFEALLAESVDGSAAERTAEFFEWETFLRRLPAMTHRMVAALAEVPTDELGEPSLASAMSTLLRISKSEAHQRIREADDLGPRAAMTGEPLQPVLTNTAAVQRSGQINAEHVRVIRRFFDQLPDFVDYGTREAAEADLAELACGLRPEELRAAADRLAAYLDQDGELSDNDRARRRYLTIGKQDRDGMSEIRGRLDPEIRAALDAVFAKWAAPGMCNPGDDSTCLDGEPSTENLSGDLRSTGQRNHDALKAICRAMLASGQLGSHKGLPVTMVVSTTLAELESGRGHAVTGGGTLLPMSEMIRQAAAAHHYLVGVRQPHRATAVPRTSQTTRLHRATHRALRARSRLYLPRLHRPGLPQRSTPPQRRPHRMDPTTQPRYRPSPRQQLPPPPALPHPRRTQRDRRPRGTVR
jgi:hypothetical protein